MKKLQINFAMTVDKAAGTVSFKDTRCLAPIHYRESTSPETIAETYRAAAAYFLEMAHMFDTASEFCPRPYSKADRLDQYMKMCEEQPMIF